MTRGTILKLYYHKKINEILKLSKAKIEIIVRALTGHDFRKRHNNIGNPGGGIQYEDFARNRKKLQHMSYWNAQEAKTQSNMTKYLPQDSVDIIQDCTVKTLTEFFSNPSILEMETT